MTAHNTEFYHTDPVAMATKFETKLAMQACVAGKPINPVKFHHELKEQ